MVCRVEVGCMCVYDSKAQPEVSAAVLYRTALTVTGKGFVFPVLGGWGLSTQGKADHRALAFTQRRSRPYRSANARLVGRFARASRIVCVSHPLTLAHLTTVTIEIEPFLTLQLTYMQHGQVALVEEGSQLRRGIA